MRIRTFDELMVSIRSAGDVPRLRVFVKRLEARIDFAERSMMRNERGSETVPFPVDPHRIPVFHLMDRDPLATRPNDPLATIFRVGPMTHRVLAIGLFPHSADPFWHGVRILTVMQELLAEREADRRPIPTHPFPGFRKRVFVNAAAHGRMAAYERSRLALDILDGLFRGRIRQKCMDLRREGLHREEQLKNRMRMFMDHLVNTELVRAASEEETTARALVTGQAIPALIDGMPIDPYN
ncbi:MAG TPA: hypothetical protein VMU11_00160 [Verrucomicrobiae bacterium]|nr:hypothetical protein [Verrucomicrobiae bacterium]